MKPLNRSKVVSVLDVNLLQILKAYESINTNHIILRFTNDDRDIEELIEEVGTYIVL